MSNYFEGADTTSVGELKERLQDFDDDMPVVACANYGDRNGTMQLITLQEVEATHVDTSGYSESGFKVTDDGSEGEVLLLNYESI